MRTRLTKRATALQSQRIITLVRSGLKQREVAAQLGITRSLVAYYTSTRGRQKAAVKTSAVMP